LPISGWALAIAATYMPSTINAEMPGPDQQKIEKIS
jgi:hypothetical protein